MDSFFLVNEHTVGRLLKPGFQRTLFLTVLLRNEAGRRICVERVPQPVPRGRSSRLGAPRPHLHFKQVYQPHFSKGPSSVLESWLQYASNGVLIVRNGAFHVGERGWGSFATNICTKRGDCVIFLLLNLQRATLINQSPARRRTPQFEHPICA
jgi:hypothetical protein